MIKRLIGLSGYAQAGKDSVGNVLQKNHEFAQRSFAQPMRDALKKLDPYVDDKGMRLNDALLREGGWEWAKKNTDTRHLLQVLGTDVGREMFGENFWVEQAFKEIQSLRYVVFTDVRFPNEAESIKSAGGTVWRVTRPGVEAANAHISEHSLDNWSFDHIINNNSTLEDLANQVDYTVARIVRGL